MRVRHLRDESDWLRHILAEDGSISCAARRADEARVALQVGPNCTLCPFLVVRWRNVRDSRVRRAVTVVAVGDEHGPIRGGELPCGISSAARRRACDHRKEEGRSAPAEHISLCLPVFVAWVGAATSA